MEKYYRMYLPDSIKKDRKNITFAQKPIQIPNIKDRLAHGFRIPLRVSQLCREKDQTVLHCYLYKDYHPDAISVRLGSQETYIVDAETGTHYKARGTYDNAIWGYEQFALRGNGYFDFPIYFAPLPETVRYIYIFGVPEWGFSGNEIYQIKKDTSEIVADSIPHFHIPHVIEKGKLYTEAGKLEYDIYGDFQLVKPSEAKLMAIWRSSENTYLAIATKANRNRIPFAISSKTTLIDEV